VETTEKIVEAYCRYIKNWATIPNIKCSGQFEIDLIAVDPNTSDRYHIETGVSISGSFSKLTAKSFSTNQLKTRTQQAGQRRTVGYFAKRKFGAKEIVNKLKEYGFKKGQYSKVIVTWGWTLEAKSQADEFGIILWDFRRLLAEIGESFSEVRTYFTDDTLRTLQLFVKSLGKSSSRHKEEDMPTAQDFRVELSQIFRESEEKGLSSIEVLAKDLHQRLGGYPSPNHRMPVCCDVMRSDMKLGDTVVSEPKKGKGASLKIRYIIPRSQKELPLDQLSRGSR